MEEGSPRRRENDGTSSPRCCPLTNWDAAYFLVFFAAFPIAFALASRDWVACWCLGLAFALGVSLLAWATQQTDGGRAGGRAEPLPPEVSLQIGASVLDFVVLATLSTGAVTQARHGSSVNAVLLFASSMIFAAGRAVVQVQRLAATPGGGLAATTSGGGLAATAVWV